MPTGIVHNVRDTGTNKVEMLLSEAVCDMVSTWLGFAGFVKRISTSRSGFRVAFLAFFQESLRDIFSLVSSDPDPKPCPMPKEKQTRSTG
jgi:hypothetical protein